MHRAMKFLRKEVTMSDVIEIIQEIDNEGRIRRYVITCFLGKSSLIYALIYRVFKMKFDRFQNEISSQQHIHFTSFSLP